MVASSPWTPARLGPFAWYDAHLGGTPTQIRDLSRYGRAPAVLGAGSNVPQWLPWEGQGRAYLPGVNGNRFNTPFKAAFRSSDEYDVSFRGEMPAVPGGTYRCPVGLGNGSVTGCHLTVRWASTIVGQLQWVSADGSSFFNAGYTYTGLTPGKTYWFRVTIKASTGGYAFYWAPDQESEPTIWTLGLASSTSSWVLNSGSPTTMDVGDLMSGGYPYLGYLHKVVWRTAIGGPKVFEFDAAKCSQTGYTDDDGNVWTANRAASGRKLVVQSPAANSNRSAYLLGSDDLIDVPIAAMPSFGIANPFTYALVARVWHRPESTARLLMFSDANSNLGRGSRMLVNSSADQLVLALGDGAEGVSAVSVPVYGSRMLLAAAIGASNGVFYQNTDGSATIASRPPASQTPTSSTMKISLDTQAATGYADMEFEALLTFDRALSTSEIAMITNYYKGGL